MSYNPQNPNGQVTMANSAPVVIASNQSAVPVSDGGSSITVDGSISQSGTWNINNVSGTVSLPTGAATAAKQPALGTAGVSSLDVITVQGIPGMYPMIIDGSGVTQPVSAISLPLPTGAATESTLSSIDGKLPTLTTSSGALVVDGSNVIQPISGNVNANITGSISNTDFEINNGGGAAAVNIQDGGNSITVDGTVTVDAGVGDFTVVQSDETLLKTTVFQTNANSLVTQAELYQQGTAVGAGNPIEVTLANTSTNTNAIIVDGSGFTQPINGTVTADVSQGGIAVSNTDPLFVAEVTTSTGGLSAASGAATNTPVVISSDPGKVYGWFIYNPNPSAAYIQFFNTASPSVGTLSPTYSIGIPGLSGANVFGLGIQHSTAISIAATTGRANNTAPASSVDYNIFYK